MSPTNARTTQDLRSSAVSSSVGLGLSLRWNRLTATWRCSRMAAPSPRVQQS